MIDGDIYSRNGISGAVHLTTCQPAPTAVSFLNANPAELKARKMWKLLTQNITWTLIVTTFDTKYNDFFNSNYNNFLTQMNNFFNTKYSNAKCNNSGVNV